MSAVEEIKNQQACCYCATVTTKKTNRTTASGSISITRNVCQRGFTYYFNIKYLNSQASQDMEGSKTFWGAAHLTNHACLNINLGTLSPPPTSSPFREISGTVGVSGWFWVLGARAQPLPAAREQQAWGLGTCWEGAPQSEGYQVVLRGHWHIHKACCESYPQCNTARTLKWYLRHSKHWHISFPLARTKTQGHDSFPSPEKCIPSTVK